MSTILKNDEVKIGEREIDIRELNKANKDQLLFRTNALSASYLKYIADNLYDIERMMLVVLKKMGVEDLSQEFDKLYKELKEDGKQS